MIICLVCLRFLWVTANRESIWTTDNQPSAASQGRPTQTTLALSKCLFSASRRLKVCKQPPMRSCPKNTNDLASFGMLNLWASSTGTPLHHQPLDWSVSSGRVWVRRWRLKSGRRLFACFHPHSGHMKVRLPPLQALSIAVADSACLFRERVEPDERLIGGGEMDMDRLRAAERRMGSCDDIRLRLGPEERVGT